MYTTFDVAI